MKSCQHLKVNQFDDILDMKSIFTEWKHPFWCT